MTSEQLAEGLLTLLRMVRPQRQDQDDITPQQYWLLRLIYRTGPLNIGELANGLGITTGSATMACKRLEKSGLLTRERQPEDERVVKVTLTKEGLAVIAARRQRQIALIARLLEVFDQEEQQALQGYIERLLDAAEKQGLSA